jgi:hypothetical protein
MSSNLLYIDWDRCGTLPRPLPFPGPRTGEKLGPWFGGAPIGPIAK